MGRGLKKPGASASFKCRVCGQRASHVTLVPAGQPDRRLTPERPKMPIGISTLTTDLPRLSIDGGPVSFTLHLSNDVVERVRDALTARNAAQLYAINEEFAPFWCPMCNASYCEAHYPRHVVYDQGFFDAIWGTCPSGHHRKLAD
jgi:hypothetical protein